MNAKYTIVQYVPSTGERLNVGVIAWDNREMLCRFLSDWGPLQNFTHTDVSFLKELAKGVEQLSRKYTDFAINDLDRTPKQLEQMIDKWQNSIQYSPPLGATVGPTELLSRITKSVLRDAPLLTMAPTVPKSTTRGRAIAANIAKRIVFETVRKKIQAEPGEHVKANHTVPGTLNQQHRFDVVLANGVIQGAVQAVSFEVQESERLQKEIDATAWIVEDVKRKSKKLQVAIFALPPPEKRAMYTRAEKVFESLDASLLPSEHQMAIWTNKVVTPIKR